MARTPPSEILLTIQAVKEMQADLATLAQVVERLGERLLQLEARMDASNTESGYEPGDSPSA